MSLINTLLKIWEVFSSGLSDVYDVIVQPLDSLLTLDIPIIDTVLDFVLNTVNIGDLSVLDLMFGLGIPFVIIFAIVKWVIDILP